MSCWLVGEHHGERIRYRLRPGISTVGRSTSNDLTLSSRTVSRNHAEIHLEGDALAVSDLGSLNGTWINGTPVRGRARARPGDLVEFGSVALRVWIEESSSTPDWSEEASVSESLHLSREETRSRDLEAFGLRPRVLDLLTEVGQLLVVPGALEETFDRLLELVERAIPASRTLLLLSEEGKGEPIQRAARIHGDRAADPLMLSRTMLRMVLDEGSAFLTRDVLADERFRNQQSVLASGVHSAMAAPLVHADEILGVLYADTTEPEKSYEESDLRVFTLLGQMIGAKITNARLLEVSRERQRLRADLEAARNIQRRLLPQSLPEIPGYEIAGTQSTCEAVGGDLYDVAALPTGRCQIALGDVSGKGMPAALLMCDVLGTLRALRGAITKPEELTRRLDDAIRETTDPELYVTLFLAELDPASHRLEYVNAGHPPPYLVEPGGSLRRLPATGRPVGFDLPEIGFEAQTVQLPPGATLVIYSDGIAEATRGEQMFGERRLPALLAECSEQSASNCAKRLQEAVDEFLGDRPYADDVTLLVVRHTH